MASKTHEYLMEMFDSVTDALAAERQGHFDQVLTSLETARVGLDKAEQLASKIQERLEMKASKL
jgi:hypothetical protein